MVILSEAAGRVEGSRIQWVQLSRRSFGSAVSLAQDDGVIDRNLLPKHIFKKFLKGSKGNFFQKVSLGVPLIHGGII